MTEPADLCSHDGPDHVDLPRGGQVHRHSVALTGHDMTMVAGWRCCV